MPHLLACRTKGDHHDVDRAADDAAAGVRSNRPHNRSAHRHSPNVRRPSAIRVVRQRVTRALTGDPRRDAAPAPDPCAPSTRSAPGRPA
jgi:hypothetical protein